MAVAMPTFPTTRTIPNEKRPIAAAPPAQALAHSAPKALEGLRQRLQGRGEEEVAGQLGHVGGPEVYPG
jgi:hypothetical protein